MKKLGIDVDKKKFCDYLASRYRWFGETLDDVFVELKKEAEPMNYRRIDHLMSDIGIDGRKIILNIQDGDPFLEGAHTVLPSMNIAIRMKDDEKYFILNKVDYF